MLATKLQAEELSMAQSPPKYALHVRRIFVKFSCPVRRHCFSVDTPSPYPSPPKAGERGEYIRYESQFFSPRRR
jgi:hypothetical protein